MTVEAFPLQWPMGFQRTRYPKKSRFKVNMGAARDGLIDELRKMNASMIVISSNVPIRQDGLPYAGRYSLNDHGAAVYFMWHQKSRVLACDSWDKIEDNLHALELAVSAMRGLERWGVSQILERSFEGFTALPAPEIERKKAWWEILKCNQSSEPEIIEKRYRELARFYHPDLGGGNPSMMAEINRAIDEARRLRGI